MNLSMIFYVLSWVLCFSGVFLTVPVITAAAYGEWDVFVVYLTTAIIYFALGFICMRRKPKEKRFYARDGYMAVAFSWFLIGFLGAVPLFMSGDIQNFIDALFESVSGFTTTGATILDDVESISRAGSLWRCFTHWVGGMGILVFAMAVFSIAGGSGIYLMRAESTGATVEKLVPKIRESAGLLYGIYTGLTVFETVLLIFGGMSFYEAITTAFSTAGTGGFSTLNSSIAGYSPFVQYVVAIFMALFGLNFNVYFCILLRKFRRALGLEECHWYVFIMAIATIIVWYDNISSFPTIEEAFRHSFFQVSSIMTTTGSLSVYTLADWGWLAKGVLVILMFIGACGGSTGGGIKISRLLILGKYCKQKVISLLHPKLVSRFKVNGSDVSRETVHGVLLYLIGYIFIFSISAFVVLLFERCDLITVFTCTASAINNVGPAFSLDGYVSSFSDFSAITKLVFVFDMIAGRLEIIPVLVMVSYLGGSVSKPFRFIYRKALLRHDEDEDKESTT
ncbi:MAG: TrkH family potassium uptake protein [Firmicutes bacterium]|nr:TrkH family potassium uptake protein [Bacillota bacterium]